MRGEKKQDNNKISQIFYFSVWLSTAGLEFHRSSEIILASQNLRCCSSNNLLGRKKGVFLGMRGGEQGRGKLAVKR